MTQEKKREVDSIFAKHIQRQRARCAKCIWKECVSPADGWCYMQWEMVVGCEKFREEITHITYKEQL